MTESNKKGHVAVDDGQHRDRNTVRLYTGDRFDRDVGPDPRPGHQPLGRVFGGKRQHFGRIAFQVVSAGPAEQDERVEMRPLARSDDLARAFDLFFPLRILPDGHVPLPFFRPQTE
ncbi:hypothetical protein LZK73_00455 [Neorhizobium galegae]|nr:hypothetical protein LZK73_00455 [Neorhizobium galegae]